MKLHLPKTLLTAVLAAVVSGISSGITVNDNYYVTIDTREENYTYDGTIYEYKNGVITLNNTPSTFSAYITLDYDAFYGVSTNTDILYVNTSGSIWGIRATTDHDVTGKWEANGEHETNASIMAPNDLQAYATGSGDNRVIAGLKVEFKSGGSGTVGTSLTTATGTPVFVCNDLRQDGKTFSSVQLSSALVSSITIIQPDSGREGYKGATNTKGNWFHSFETATTSFLDKTSGKYEVNNTENKKSALDSKSIVVGGSTQLFLQSWGNGQDLEVLSDIYVGSTTYVESGYPQHTNVALRFGNDDKADGGQITNIKGNIYIVEDTIFSSEITKTKDNGKTYIPSAINFENAVTDVVDGMDTGSTLTIRGEGYVFKSGVTLSGLNLESTARVTFTENSTLTIDGAIHNAGSLELNGALVVTNLSGLNTEYYSDGGKSNGIYAYGTSYQLVSGDGTLSGSTSKANYNGQTYNFSNGCVKVQQATGYVVASGTVQVGGDNAAADTKDADKYLVLKDATMQLNAREDGAELTADQVVTSTVGSGTIDLRTTATIGKNTATAFEGTIKVSEGGILQICQTDYTYSGYSAAPSGTADLSSLKEIELAGGELRHASANMSLGNIKVTADSTLNVFDIATAQTIITIDSLSLGKDAELDVIGRWKSNTVITELSGTGTLNVAAPTESSESKVLSIAGTNEFTGTINQTGGTIKATAGLSVGEITQTGGTLELKSGTTNVTKSMNVKSVNLTGSTKLELGVAEGTDTTKQFTIGTTSGNANLQLHEGKVELGNGNHALGHLDVSNGGKSVAQLTLKKGAIVTTNGQMWVGDKENVGVSLEDTASLKLGNVTIKGNGSTAATIQRNDETGDGDLYGSGNVAYSISNAAVEVTADKANGTAISNRLLGVSLTNKGEGTLSATNGYNGYTAINAEVGSINITNFNKKKTQDGVSLQQLTISANLVVGVHTGDNSVIDKTQDEATLSIAQGGTATFGKGSQLYANLTLSNGTKLSLAEGGLAMGSTLTLGTGLVLDTATLTAVNSLTDDKLVTLFSGVDELKLGLGENSLSYSKVAEGGPVSMNTYFSGVNNNIYLGYENGNVFAGMLAVPEPTTATLSLLALAGLAARRRRK